MKKYIQLLLFLPCSVLLSYPIQAPYQEGYLRVSDKHEIFYALYGNPQGIPAVVLHGGPGIGCTEALSSFFDLTRFHLIMFDQRGAMRSKPFACMEENTTQHLIQDIERLKEHLHIDKWIVFGNSWGSLLAILYGERYPNSVHGFILQGVFLGREEDLPLFFTNNVFTLITPKAFLHYAYHQLFLEPNQALLYIGRMQHIPTIIVHGAQDTSCLPEQALLLHRHLENSCLWLVENGSHSLNDPSIASTLIKATDAMSLCFSPFYSK
jgi:pimeloyl-ACP methyl ester carboxylesterase